MPDRKRKLQTGFVIANVLPTEVTELHIKVSGDFFIHGCDNALMGRAILAHLVIGSKQVAPLSRPIRNKATTNRNPLAHISPRLVPTWFIGVYVSLLNGQCRN